MEPRIGVTLGDPAGIGAELVLHLVRVEGPAANVTIFGSRAQLEAASAALRWNPGSLLRFLPPAALDAPEAYLGGPSLLDLAPLAPQDLRPGVPTLAGAGAQVKYLSSAVTAARAGHVAALLTAPVSKIGVSGVMGRFTGQTELLARLAGAHTADVAMAFTSERIRTVLVTTHMPLRDVGPALKPERIERVCRLEVRHLEELGFERPRLVVAGFNPHAGERGMFGTEEREVIGPAVGGIQARFGSEGMRATVAGPLPVETAFRRHLAGEYDAVVAMYHDQATLPCKLLAFGEAVNVTLGLPFVRTSVDHGTAHDIAGTGRADPRGMFAAYQLARRLIARRNGADRSFTAPLEAPVPGPAR
jgi:4-hydroxythreonine-4-phosphate dehydrogenase